MKNIFKDYGVGAGCLICLLVLVLLIGLAAFEAWIVMLLWNNVLCAIFTSVPTIGFWLAWGVMILCNMLFKSHVSINKN